MTLQWKNKIESTDPLFEKTGTYIDAQTWGSVTLSEVMKQPVRKFVEKGERWCHYRNSESYGRTKNLSKYGNYNCYNLIEGVFGLVNNESFGTKQILSLIDKQGLSDGGRQRAILSFMVCEGKIKKVLISKDKNGKKLKRPYYKFSINKNPERCPYLVTYKKENKIKLFCNFDWKNASITYLFDEER